MPSITTSASAKLSGKCSIAMLSPSKDSIGFVGRGSVKTNIGIFHLFFFFECSSYIRARPGALSPVPTTYHNL